MPPNRTSCVPPLLTTVLVAFPVTCWVPPEITVPMATPWTNCEPEKIVALIAVPPSTS